MNPKDYLTNNKFCPIPWTGFQYNSSGDVLNCIRSQRPIGNLKDKSIHEILKSSTETKQNMLNHKEGLGCSVCYDLEKNKNSFDIISDRVFYLRELKSVDNSLYDQIDNFDLHKIDIRWSNVCNHACVYCGPEYSSKWVAELKLDKPNVPTERVEELKQFVFDNAHKLKHVYLAGGEPLLMKENEELLNLLLKVNPDVNLRVNTNLSKTGTPVFNLICQFKNIHWIISVDEIEEEFEYVRYGGVWLDFLENLNIIRTLDHKVSFNVLHHLLNFRSVFKCINFLKSLGFHNNSFILGPITTPDYLNIRHLPDNMLNLVKSDILEWLDKNPGFLLENGLKNMLQYINTPSKKNIDLSLKKIEELDLRRNINSKVVFKEFYDLLEGT